MKERFTKLRLCRWKNHNIGETYVGGYGAILADMALEKEEQNGSIPRYIRKAAYYAGINLDEEITKQLKIKGDKYPHISN